ncbi:MAG: DNA (cytosine-5-)-methyltransferase [Clostridia bacterium]
MKNYKIVSLFSGIGGFELGIQNSNLDVEVVFASEIDKYAQISYAANFNGKDLYGDITKIDEKIIPDHDILVGGFPCQAFSIAGKQNGFEDARGTLFFDVARILKEKQPKYILLENVKNLISHDKGKTINVILNTLNDLNYTVDFTVLNSNESGVPQNRERTFIVGILNQPCEKFVTDYRSKKINELKQSLNTNNYNGFNFFSNLTFQAESYFIKDTLDYDVNLKYHINNEYVDKFLNDNDFKCNAPCESKIIKLFDLPRDVWNDLERQRRVYSINGISPTILARSDATKIFVNGKVRKLTPIENLRIQGFSKNFISNIKIANMSDAQLYKQSGNAVSPPVITGIFNQLATYMEE